MLAEWYFRCWNISNVTKGFGDETMSQKMFSSGTDISKNERMCWSFAMLRTNIDFIWGLKHQQNQGNDAWESTINNSFGSVQTIFKDHLGLKRVKSRLVTKFLRKRASRSWMWSNAFWLSRRIQTNYYYESWIYAYDPEKTD